MLTIDAHRKAPRGRIDRRFVLALCAIVVLHIALVFLLGTQKQGFFIDEYFTFTLSNHQYGLNMQIVDNAWNDPGGMLLQLVVPPDTPGAAFDYARVMRNNAADVHPPLYYLLFHTLCSIVPGLFSKWIGIFLNIPFSLGCLALVALLAWHFTHSRALTLLAAAVYACNPGALSNALLLRMYCMLSFFVLLAIWLHFRFLSGKLSPRLFLPCIAVTYFCGFMTQYYFIVFAGLLTAGCFVYWLLRKRAAFALGYAGTLLAALGATYLFYPAWVQHIFKGYRGEDAVKNLTSNDTALKLLAFLQEINAVLFAYCLPVLAVCCLALVLWLVWKNRRCGAAGLLRALVRTPLRAQALFLGALCCVTFFILAKISGITERNFSVRYFMLLFAPMLLLCTLGAVWLAVRAMPRQHIATGCVAVLFLCLNVFGLTNGSSVEYLFQWDAQLLQNARDNHDTPVVLMHNSTLFIGMSNQLMQYDQLYVINQQSPQPIPNDERLTKAARVLLYMEKPDEPLNPDNKAPLEQYMPYLNKNFPALTNVRNLPSPIYHYQLFELSV